MTSHLTNILAYFGGHNFRRTEARTDNKKINANFKKGGSVVKQSVELLMNSSAEKKMQQIKAEENLFLFVAFFLTNCIASYPPFLKLRLSLMRYLQA